MPNPMMAKMTPISSGATAGEGFRRATPAAAAIAASKGATRVLCSND